jgi:predicted AAA+ superfamily ATPase
MRFLPRAIAGEVSRAARAFPALLVTGPRRAGKTTLLRRLFPNASYELLEDPEVLSRVRSDPRAFLDDLTLPVILDEIQNAPELMAYVRARIDHSPSRKGRWILTGSQEAPLMRGVTESLAGRTAVLQLLPLSTSESPKVSLLRGGFPEVVARPKGSGLWFRSYVQTYLERDVRAVTAIRDLSMFRRFLALLASRCGQVLNRTEIAAPLGVTVATLTQWIGILEITGQIVLVPPYFENFGKRLLKSPKLYFLDSGLACHLLGIETERALAASPFAGPLFEGFVASEILKHQIARGLERKLYYFRDQQGLEVDFIVPAGHQRLLLVEAKSTRTVTPRMAQAGTRLAASMHGYTTEVLVVHPPGKNGPDMRAIAPGAAAIPLGQLLKRMDGES